MTTLLISLTLSLLTACRQEPAPEKPAEGTVYLDDDGDGYESDVDCDDSSASVYPDAEETCDGVDNNCNGEIDEGVTMTFYQDDDADGYGNPAITEAACVVPEGYVTDNTDCDDSNATVYPTAAEICDTVDNNCDGLTDDEDPLATDIPLWYIDGDGDGFGYVETSTSACVAPEGYVSNADDCDDNNAAINPESPEICDGIDNDCDGLLEADTMGSTETCPALHCKAILESGANAASGPYWIQPDDTLPAFEAYCDMTTDDGGWTLLITLDPATVTFPTVADWPDHPEPSGTAPTYSGLYKGSLAEFNEVREEIASGSVVAYGSGLSEAELNLIRELYGYNSRVTAAPLLGDPPSCSLSYGATQNITGCTSKGHLNNNDTIIGWAVDPSSTYSTHCWFARGDCCSTAGGSSLCNGDPNGTKWARTWFR